MSRIINEFGQSLTTIVRIMLLSKWFGALKIKNPIKRTKCIVLGNGPSLKTTLKKHKTFLINNDTLCVNAFVSTDHYEEIKPLYYVLAATVFFQPDEKISLLYINSRNGLFSELQKKTTWNLYLIVPFMAKKSKEFQALIQANKNLHPLYINQTPVEGFSFFKHILFRKKLGMARPHNVLIPSIFSLISIGYKEILIIGADHSWLDQISVSNDNLALVNHKHFYDTDDTKPQAMQDYIKRPRRLHEVIYKFYLSFKGYWELKDYASKRNVKIYNSSELSMIDAFERKPLDEPKK
ncbi:MAG: hypothetical protein ACI865_002118 [Flavobacteriaceae bacterium]|jgi:hypothetical protein